MGFFSGIKGAVGGLFGADVGGKKRARRAAREQVKAAREAIRLQREQMARARELYAPRIAGGEEAFQAQLGLLGLGPGAEAPGFDPYAAIRESPEYQAALQQGEEALLQSAAATGGLRGGRVQEALLQFRPQLLSSAIQQRFQRLGEISGVGERAIGGELTVGAGGTAGIGQALAQMGAARAGREMVPSGLEALGMGIGGTARTALGLYGLGKLGAF